MSWVTNWHLWLFQNRCYDLTALIIHFICILPLRIGALYTLIFGLTFIDRGKYLKERETLKAREDLTRELEVMKSLKEPEIPEKS